MGKITVCVMERGPARFNMVGQKLPDNLRVTDQQISHGLVKRLADYAVRELKDVGFDHCTTWPCEVSTMDGDSKPADRLYCVTFTHEKGGSITLQGIMTQKGWPILDHGLDAGRS